MSLTSLGLCAAFAGWAALAMSSAQADQCQAIMKKKTPTTMCGTFTYDNYPSNQFTITFGPGDLFTLTGVGPTAGINGTGTFECQGNNYYTTSYSVNEGQQVVWLARFPSSLFLYTTAGYSSLGSGKLTAGACPAD